MATSAADAALSAVVARLEAIVPGLDAGERFTRKGTGAVPASTRARKRLFDVDFEGHAPGRGDGNRLRTLNAKVSVDYPAGRSDRAIEQELLLDSEAIVRDLTVQGSWAGTPVARCEVSTEVERGKMNPVPGQGTAVVQLVVSLALTYVDRS